MAKPDQRTFLRINTGKTLEVQFETQGKAHSALLSDLSVYGAKCTLTSQELTQLSVGQMLSPIRFEIGGKSIETAAKVVRIEQESGARQPAIGIEFVDLSSDAVWILSAFIAKKVTRPRKKKKAVAKKKVAPRRKR